MKHLKKLVTLILALLMLAGATVAYAGTYVSSPFSPNISQSSAPEQQPEAEPTTAPEGEPMPAPEASEEPASEEQLAEETLEIVGAIMTESENGIVNIRAAASVDAEIIGQLSTDDRVAVLGVQGDWTKIRYDDGVGYVYSKYLQTVALEASPASVEIRREVRITTTLGSVVNEGDKVTLTGKLIGFTDVEVELQWQYNDNHGGGWKDIEGAFEDRYSYTVSPENVNYDWRLMVEIVG